jgi:hypothetical protein
MMFSVDPNSEQLEHLDKKQFVRTGPVGAKKLLGMGD